VQELSQKKGKRQTPRIIADPIEKSHLILMPEYATKNDVSILKNDAYRAQINGDLESFSVSEVQQESATEVLEDLTNIINISIEERLGDKKLPVIEPDITEVKSSFTFEVVKVNDSGSIVNRIQGSATQKIEDLGNGVSLEMVKIPGGSFLMGSSDKEAARFDIEGPQHYVDVPEFFMGKYVVTQGQWKEIASRTNLKVELCLKPDPSRFKEPYKDIDRWNRPVERVKWNEAVEFCKRLSKLTGRNYRLPSEAEWEYACRAGTTTPFHFGETINTELANYRGTDNEERNWSGSYGEGPEGVYREETTPVGYFKVANSFGLSDMHGNVWEWCADEWHDNYAGAPTDSSVWLNGNKNKSPLRGGSWAFNPGNCRSAIRTHYVRRDDPYGISGFRVVCDGGRTL
jgi:formylglycine-generating enzyme required for sulfatase activity